MEEFYKMDVLIIGGGFVGMLSGIYLDCLGVLSIVVECQLVIFEYFKVYELSVCFIEIFY